MYQSVAGSSASTALSSGSESPASCSGSSYFDFTGRSDLSFRASSLGGMKSCRNGVLAGRSLPFCWVLIDWAPVDRAFVEVFLAFSCRCVLFLDRADSGCMYSWQSFVCSDCSTSSSVDTWSSDSESVWSCGFTDTDGCFVDEETVDAGAADDGVSDSGVSDAVVSKGSETGFDSTRYCNIA